MSESVGIYREQSDLPHGAESVALFSGPFAVVSARQREWNAIVDLLQHLKGEEIVCERTSVELNNGEGIYKAGMAIVVNAGNINAVWSLAPSIKRKQGGDLKDVTVLVRVDDTPRQKQMLEEEAWTKFEVGRLPDWPDG